MSFGLGFGFPGYVPPGSGATLALQFAGATALDPRITFTRASSATYTNSAGLVALSPINLLTYSEQFDNAAWTKNLASVTTDVTVSPSGIVDADKITEAVGVSDHSVYRNPTLLVNTAYTFSIFAKANTRTKIGIALGFTAYGGISVRAHFNLITGTFITSANSPEAYSIVDVGNNWYKISITKTTSVAGNGSVAVYTLDESGAFTYNGDGTSGLYIWGAQLEAGAFATSYIPTVAAQATRAAENAAMTGTNFSSWYNQTEGTVFEEADVIYTGNFLTYPTYFIISDNSTSLLQVYGGLASTQITPNMQVAGVNQLEYVALNRTSGFDKLAVAYQANNTQFAMNAVTTTTDTVCSIPTVNRLDLGGRNTAYLNGHIKRITYWPRRLSNGELQAVTS